jgi:hypothetical protein
VSASSSGFTVALADGGTRYVPIEGGWTEELYRFLDPVLSALEEANLNKAEIARAVLENGLFRGKPMDAEIAFWKLGNEYGVHEEDWLPQAVETRGFLALGQELTQAFEEYRRTTPRRQIPKDAKPLYDADLGRLWFGDVLIKQFEKAAGNQRLYCKAWQEQDWRHRIDDPLCRQPGERVWKRQRRRRDTIAGLNARHKSPGIMHFRADGTGDGIIWERWE